jgi:hypothetical protein
MSSSRPISNPGQVAGRLPDWRPVDVEDDEGRVRLAIDLLVWSLRQKLSEAIRDPTAVDNDPRVQLAVALQTVHRNAQREFAYSFFRASVNKQLRSIDAIKVWPKLVTALKRIKNDLSLAALDRGLPMVVFVQHEGEHTTNLVKFQPWIRVGSAPSGDVTLPKLNRSAPVLTARQYLQECASKPFDPLQTYEEPEVNESLDGLSSQEGADAAVIIQATPAIVSTSDATKVTQDGLNGADRSAPDRPIPETAVTVEIVAASIDARPADEPVTPITPGKPVKAATATADATQEEGAVGNAGPKHADAHDKEPQRQKFLGRPAEIGRVHDPLSTLLVNEFVQDFRDRRRVDVLWRRAGEVVVGILVIALVLIGLFHLTAPWTLPFLEAHGILVRTH